MGVFCHNSAIIRHYIANYVVHLGGYFARFGPVLGGYFGPI